MSKVVDERVVEMKFDNKNFESNVKTSMSTLERLKNALKFKGGSNGLDNIGKSVKKVDMSGLSNGIETVNAKFSALQVVGMTALSNITSAAMHAGTNIVKSLAIDPVMSGFREYELQMNSIQTILANTKSKGTTMADVTAALDELNKYADLTIYNFSEMTKNIGTFTAAGVDLDTAVGAIKGIANLGAMSSSTSAQVSSAMYQLSQALATGRVSLMDWNSVVNAGMGGEQFQNALKRTAKHFGTDVDAMIEKYGSFRDSLTQGGWLTAEILNETLNQIGGAYDDVALKAQGWSDAEIAAILDLADTATEAATEVKTFSQLWTTLAEAAGSGWAKTWQLIFGDFEQAKGFFSDLHKMLEPIVTGPIDAMNSVIEGAMGGGGSRWNEFTAQLDKAGVSVDAFQKKLSEVASAKGISLDELITQYGSLEAAIGSGKISTDMISQALDQLSSSTDNASASMKELADWQKVVDEVWRGDYGNIDTGRMERLAAAGWEYAEVQKLVNKTVDGHRLTLEDLNEAQIKSMGYTEEQAKALATLAEEAKKSGGDINTLIDDLVSPKRSGRELFLEGLKNSLIAILTPLQQVAAAFGDVFGMNSDQLYGLIEGFNEFSKSIIISGDDVENLRNTFKGLFSIIHIVSTGFGKTLVFAIKAVNKILEPFGTNILEVTGALGDALYQLDKWITSGDVIEDALTGIGDAISWLITPLKEFWDTLFPSGEDETGIFDPLIQQFDNLKSYIETFQGLSISEVLNKFWSDVQDAFNKLRNLKWEDVLKVLRTFGENVRTAFSNVVKNMKEVGPDIIEGLQNGLKDGVEGVFEFMKEIGEKIIEAIKAVLGIHSPSTVMFEIGQNIVQGLINGIKSLIGGIGDLFSGVADDITAALSGIDWGVVAAAVAAAGIFVIFYKLTDAMQGFASAAKNVTAPMAGAGKVLSSISSAIDTFTGNVTSGTKFQNFANAIKTLAMAVGILAVSVAVIAGIETGNLIKAVTVIAVLAGVIAALSAAVSKFSEGKNAFETVQINTLLLSIAGSFLMISVATKIISGVDARGFAKAIAILAVLGGVAAGLAAVSKFSNNIDGAAVLLGKIGVAFLLLGVASRIIGGISDEGLAKASYMISAFAAVTMGLVAVTSIAGPNADKAATFLSKIGGAFLLLGVTARLLGGISDEGLVKASYMISEFAFVVGALITVTQIAGNNADRAAAFIGKIGVAFALLAVTARLLGGMSVDEMKKAGVAIAAFVGIVSALVAATRLAPEKEIAKISGTILAMAGAIGILAVVATLLGTVNTKTLAKGTVAVAALGAIVAGMAQATRGMPRDAQKTFIGISIAIAALAASLAVLSFLDTGKLLGASVALGAVIGMFALLTKATTGLRGGKGGSLVPIIAMVAMLVTVAGSLYALSQLPIDSLAGSAASISALLLALSVSVKLMSGVGKMSAGAVASMAIMIGVMTALAGFLMLLQTMDVQASLPNVLALSTLLIAMSTACLILGQIKSMDAGAVGAMAVMAAVVAILAQVLVRINGLDPVGSIANVTALSILLNAMASACLILGQIKSVSATAVGSIAMLTVIALGLTEVLQALNGVNPQASIPNVVALSVLLNAMAAACVILGQIKSVSVTAVGTMAVLTAIVAALAGVLQSVNGLNPSASIPNVTALSILLGALTGVTLILSKANINVAAALQGALGFVAVVGTLGLVFGAIGGIVNALGASDEVLSALDTAGEILGKIGNAIGELVGGLIGGALEGVTDALPAVGENLAAFMENAQPFFDAVSNLDPTSAQSLGMLATALAGFVGGGILEDISSFITGGSSFDALADLGDALCDFNDAVAGVNGPQVMIAAMALQTLASAMSDIPNSGGLLGDLLGGKDYTGFSTGMASLGLGLSMFDISTSTVNTDGIKLKAEALGSLITAMSNIPNSGGLLQDLLGGKDYPNFADGMASLGKGLASFNTNTPDISPDTIGPKTEALRSLIAVMSEIPPSGGFLQGLLGDQDYSNFATGLASIGTGLSDFNSNSGEIDASTMSQKTQALKALIETLAKIPAEGGLLDKMFGGGEGINYQAFANGLTSIGDALKSYSDKVPEDLSKINSANTAVKTVINFLKNNADASEEIADGIINIKKIPEVGSAISQYATNLGNVDTGKVASTANSVKTIVQTIEDMADMDTSGIATFKSAIEELSTVSFDRIVENFSTAASKMVNVGLQMMQNLASGIQQGIGVATSAILLILVAIAKEISSTYDDFEQAGTKIGKSIADGLDDSSSSITGSIRSVMNAAVSSLSGYYRRFYSQGASISSGLAAGIRSGLSSARAAADELARVAARASASRLEINSPSKVFRRQGLSIGEGLVQGIQRSESVTRNASNKLASSSISIVSDAVKRIQEAFDSDMDVNPVITPVIDLSNVQNGVSGISALMSAAVPSDLLAEVGMINGAMNQRNRTIATFDDVVYSIDRLRRDMQDLPRNTYSVGGITYDDGTAIANAVESLIRATRIERRM